MWAAVFIVSGIITLSLGVMGLLNARPDNNLFTYFIYFVILIIAVFFITIGLV